MSKVEATRFYLISTVLGNMAVRAELRSDFDVEDITQIPCLNCLSKTLESGIEAADESKVQRHSSVFARVNHGIAIFEARRHWFLGKDRDAFLGGKNCGFPMNLRRAAYHDKVEVHFLIHLMVILKEMINPQLPRFIPQFGSSVGDGHNSRSLCSAQGRQMIYLSHPAEPDDTDSNFSRAHSLFHLFFLPLGYDVGLLYRKNGRACDRTHSAQGVPGYFDQTMTPDSNRPFCEISVAF